ncbi:hypothetical protein ACFQH5_20540 [Halomonas salifodinae]|uniref:Uncharacterized protein n=1 Tax=Halomonas salifodinae TaxID=438745 RepID=A0ABW2F4Q5_9GAMM
MGIKNMSYTTCEQVLCLREAAIRMEKQRDLLAEALRKIASCESMVDGDVVSVARAALAAADGDGGGDG